MYLSDYKPPVLSEGDASAMFFPTFHIDRCVGIGWKVLKMCASIEPSSDVLLAAMLQLRHALQLSDAISVMLKHGVGYASKPMLEKLLDVCYGMRYMFDSNTQVRATAYLIWYYHERRDTLARCLVENRERKHWGSEERRDACVYDAFALPDHLADDVQAKIAAIDTILTEPRFARAEADYQKWIQANRKPSAWYGLLRGPRTIRDMARRLQLTEIHVFDRMVDEYMGVIHQSDVILAEVEVDASSIQIELQRNIDGWNNIVYFVRDLLLTAYNDIWNGFSDERIEDLCMAFMTGEARHFDGTFNDLWSEQNKPTDEKQ